MGVTPPTARAVHHGLLRNALACILPAALLSGVLARIGAAALGLEGDYLLKAVALFVTGAALVLAGVGRHHPYRTFGAANQVTVARGVLVALLAALVGERTDTGAPALATVLAASVAVLDGVDGWLARRTRMASDFGARFDMETDAALIMVLSGACLAAGQGGQLGAGLRAAALWFCRGGLVAAQPAPAAAAEPAAQDHRRHPGHRLLIPPLRRSWSGRDRAANAAAGLGALSASFRVMCCGCSGPSASARGGAPERPTPPCGRRLTGRGCWPWWCSMPAVTFHNVWPTLGVHWPGELSVEFGCYWPARWHCPMPGLGRAAAGCGPLLAALVVVFGRALCRCDGSALYGRDINLYWDAPQFANVAGMLARVASRWAVAGTCAWGRSRCWRCCICRTLVAGADR